jgi:outer membrane receptor protein involved in Fe transport
MASGFRRTGTALDLPQGQTGPLPADADAESRQSAYLYLKGGDWSFAGSLLSRLQHLASGPYGSIPGDTGNYYENRRLSGEFKWEPRTDSVKWMLRFFGDRNTFSDNFRYATTGQPDQQSDHDPDRSLGIEAQGRATLAEHLSLTFGTEVQYHRYSGAYTDAQGAPGVDTEVSYGIGNTYLEANWTPSDAWNLVGGLQRADWIPGHVSSTIGGVEQDATKESISRLTPRLSVIWKPAPGDVVKAIFGQGFRFPTIFERYYTDDASQAANPGIKPEVLTSSQLSWSRTWASRWTSHMAATLLSWQDAIIPGGSQGMEQYQNAPDAKKGRTLEAETAWHHRGLELSGGAGWYDWTYQGTTLENSSRWNGVLKAIQRMGAWSLAGDARYVDGRQAAATGSSVPANWTLRGSVRYDTERFWGQVSMEDLSNSRRRDLVAPEYAPVTWMAADGRAVRLVLGFRM